MTDLQQIFCEWFGITLGPARIAERLYAAQGRMVSLHELASLGGQTLNGTRLSIKLLRAAMEPYSIQCVRSVGYQLTGTGMDDCRTALADAEARRAAA